MSYYFDFFSTEIDVLLQLIAKITVTFYFFFDWNNYFRFHVFVVRNHSLTFKYFSCIFFKNVSSVVLRVKRVVFSQKTVAIIFKIRELVVIELLSWFFVELSQLVNTSLYFRWFLRNKTKLLAAKIFYIFLLVFLLFFLNRTALATNEHFVHFIKLFAVANKTLLLIWNHYYTIL